MIFNKAKFSKDILAKVGSRSLTDVQYEIGISYPSLWRAAKTQSNPDMNVLISLLKWLNKPFEYYLKKEAPMHK